MSNAVNLTGLHSPDTGTTSYAYDAAGKRTSQTDARSASAVTTYAYDALNRLTSIAYPDSTLNVAFFYDKSDFVTGCEGSAPIGHVTGVTDHSGSTTYCYDRRGNVTSKRQTITDPVHAAAVELTTYYFYSPADRLLMIDYPSGTEIVYGRDAIGRITNISYSTISYPHTTGKSPRADNGTLVSNVTYYPFGPVKVITFGNGRTLTKTYDNDYQIDSITSSSSTGLVLDLQTDVMGDITAAAPILGAAPVRTYSYDHLYRLKEIDDGMSAPLERFGYNKTGDRTSRTLGTQAPQVYSYLTSTHRLGSIDSGTRSYDPRGNTTGTPALQSLDYDDRNRLVASLKQGDVNAVSYDYSGRGERVLKALTVDDTSVAYSYDEQGHLLSEVNLTADGVAEQSTEYVYMDSVPIGAIRYDNVVVGRPPRTTSYFKPVIHYLEADHLGTPRIAVTVNSPSAAPDWKWDFFGSAFGDHAADEDPDGDSVPFVMNLRYPGQQFDAETALHYNYLRDYEPNSGRFSESDPIGISADHSTYRYGLDNPLKYIDRNGESAVEVGAGVVVVLAVCYIFHCEFTAEKICSKAYPNWKEDIGEANQRLACVTKITKACITLGSMAVDPIKESITIPMEPSEKEPECPDCH